jgi:hypothetical protein
MLPQFPSLSAENASPMLPQFPSLSAENASPMLPQFPDRSAGNDRPAPPPGTRRPRAIQDSQEFQLTPVQSA